MIKVLHISPENYTGVLMDYVKAHRARGNTSRLVTLYRQINLYEEDICLDLPLVGYKKYVDLLKKLFTRPGAGIDKQEFPRQRVPHNKLETMFFSLRDTLWEPMLRRAFKKHGLWDFDIYHLEGGIGFLRSGKFIRELKEKGKKIV